MPREPLNELDAELRRLLSVTPSPQFEARVRTRLSTERMAGGWWRRRWTLAAATAAATVVIALVSNALMLDTPSSPERVPPSSDMAVTRPAPPPVESASRPPVVEPRQPRPRAPETRIARSPAPARAVQAASVTSEPEVLVDARQTAGIDRLYEMARAGTVLAVEERPATADQPIVVEPLRVPALIVDAAPAPWPPGHPAQNEFQPTKE